MDDNLCYNFNYVAFKDEIPVQNDPWIFRVEIKCAVMITKSNIKFHVAISFCQANFLMYI